jgi:hypothetical protein
MRSVVVVRTLDEERKEELKCSRRNLKVGCLRQDAIFDEVSLLVRAM